MDTQVVQNPDLWGMAVKFISEFGLPTSLCIYLLVSFGKKIDKLISLVDRLTGIMMAISQEEIGDDS